MRCAVVVKFFGVLSFFLITTFAFSYHTEKKPFPESHFIRVDSITLHYREWNAPAGKHRGNILFVHGALASTFSWRNNADTLSKLGFRIIAVDLPCVGYSERKRGLNHSYSAKGRLLWDFLHDVEKKNPEKHEKWWLI